jgi:RimJ/RimL family protein N-acetyltransferase
LITPEDAPYVHALRIDPLYNQHLSSVTGTTEDQFKWIERYKTQEARCQQLYYVIERHDGIRCGLVRLYDICAEHFTWGSWILDTNKPKLAALESAFLIYSVGFEELGCNYSVFDVRNTNERTLAFHRRFGASEIGKDDLNLYFKYTANQFSADRQIHLNTLKISEPS